MRERERERVRERELEDKVIKHQPITHSVLLACCGGRKCQESHGRLEFTQHLFTSARQMLASIPSYEITQIVKIDIEFSEHT